MSLKTVGDNTSIECPAGDGVLTTGYPLISSCIILVTKTKSDVPDTVAYRVVFLSANVLLGRMVFPSLVLIMFSPMLFDDSSQPFFQFIGELIILGSLLSFPFQALLDRAISPFIGPFILLKIYPVIESPPPIDYAWGNR